MKTYAIGPLMIGLLVSIFTSSSFAQQMDTRFIQYNRNVQLVKENNRTVMRFAEGKGAAVAWIDGLEFSAGTIEFEARGRDVLQKSFLGIAFHGIDSVTYETVYFRPFNFQATDPVRKIHAVQYSFEPDFGFQELRNTQKDKFESAIVPAGISPSDWFKVKVTVKGGMVRVFLNGSETPCMEVATLNSSPLGKKIGFWVGNLSNGDFAGLKLTK